MFKLQPMNEILDTLLPYAGNIPTFVHNAYNCIGCILLNQTRSLKKTQHKLEAVLLHLKLTG